MAVVRRKMFLLFREQLRRGTVFEKREGGRKLCPIGETLADNGIRLVSGAALSSSDMDCQKRRRPVPSVGGPIQAPSSPK